MDSTETLRPDHWYTVAEVVLELNKTEEEVQAIFDALIAKGTVGVAYYQGPATPLIQGGILMQALYKKTYAV